MKIVVGIPLLALVVLLNSIYEGSGARPPASTTVAVDPGAMIFVGLKSGDFFGGFLQRQKQRGIPLWVKYPKRHDDGFHYVYVQMPNGFGLVTALKFLMDKPMKATAIDAAVKVQGGVATTNLAPVNEIPTRILHTRVYLATADGELFYGILENSHVKPVKGFNR